MSIDLEDKSYKSKPNKIEYLVVEKDKNKQWCQSCGSEGVEGLEEEDKLEILGNLLECEANGGDGDELGDVEDN